VLALPPGPWHSELRMAVGVLRRVAGDPAAASEWLASVTSALGPSGQEQQQPVPWSLVLVVTHLLVLPPATAATGPHAVCHLALGAVVAIAEADPSKVARPVVLKPRFSLTLPHRTYLFGRVALGPDIYISVYRSIYLSIYLSIYTSIYLYICIYTYIYSLFFGHFFLGHFLDLAC